MVFTTVAFFGELVGNTLDAIASDATSRLRTKWGDGLGEDLMRTSPLSAGAFSFSMVRGGWTIVLTTGVGVTMRTTPCELDPADGAGEEFTRTNGDNGVFGVTATAGASSVRKEFVEVAVAANWSAV